MPAVTVFVPAIVAGWPAITAAVAGAATALGMAMVKEGQETVAEAGTAVESSAATVEVEMAHSDIATATMATDEQIVLTQGNVRIRVFRDERGQCRVAVTGLGRSQAELRAIGEQVVQRVAQQFIYNKLMTELRTHGFSIVKEEVSEDETVHIHVRHWEG